MPRTTGGGQNAGATSTGRSGMGGTTVLWWRSTLNPTE